VVYVPGITIEWDGVKMRRGCKVDFMASIQFNSFKIDIEVQNIDGIFSKIIGVPFSKGFWVLLRIETSSGEKESFPLTDERYAVKTYDTYEDAIDDVAKLLKAQFKES
jgi:hypothetical protein